ncbi:MAG: DUF4249 domain-containing protein, partial [Croceivirga sp.]
MKGILYIWTCLFSVQGCVEVLDIEEITNGEGNGLLLVEAILTYEFKNQELYLSRSDIRSDLERDTTLIPFLTPGLCLRDTVNVETDVKVKLMNDNGVEFTFTGTSGGRYESNEAFGLQTERDYQLEIVTRNGKAYIFQPVKVQGKARIDDIYAERTTSENGVDGVAIYVNSTPTDGVVEHYSFGYEETYKVIAPLWVNQEFKLTDYQHCPETTYTIEMVPREVQNKVCYNTIDSNEVIQTSILNNTTNDVNRFIVRFISKDNYVTSHRYSILVKQHVQRSEAYGFYETLKELSQSDEVFSQVQPGPLEANIKRVDGTDEMVLGYVDITSVSERRIYLEYADFFPGEELPPYPFPCFEESAPESHVSYCNPGLNFNLCPLSTIER